MSPLQRVYRPGTDCRLLLRLLLFLVPHLVLVASTSTSTSNYNVYHYDRAVRQFTHDGRLLQVEYAMAASEQSSPLLVCYLPPLHKKDDNDAAAQEEDVLVILSALSARRSSSSTSATATTATTTATATATTTTSSSRSLQRPQDRIVIVEEDNVVVAMSGVLADSLALFKRALADWQDYKALYYGTTPYDAESHTIGQVLATSMGRACHDHCFQGGIRPYGATMLVLAPAVPTIKSQDSDHQGDHPASSLLSCDIFQTDPSGAITRTTVPSYTSSNTQSFLQAVTIVGGRPESRARIERAIQGHCDNHNNKEHQQQQKHRNSNDIIKSSSTTNNALWERLKILSTILVEEQQQQQQTQKNTSVNKPSTTRSISERLFGRKKRNESNGDNNDDDDDESDESTIAAATTTTTTTPKDSDMTIVESKQSIWLEIVVMSRTLGIHKLTSSQIQQLLHETAATTRNKV